MNPIPRAVLGRRGTRRLRATVAFLASAAVVATGVGVSAAAPAKAVVGQGFTVSPADLEFILKQIKIAEHHANNTTTTTGPCGALLGSGPNQIASPLLSFGLRTVDGTCNNLQSGQETFGAADETFPRLTEPVFSPAGNRPADLFTPGQPAGPPTSYAQTSGSVYDTEPRTVSNLIVDQTSTNPAAVEAAGFPVRTQGNEGVVPCTVDPSPGDPNGTPDDCVPANQTLFIPNVTTDVGLSPPFNGLFTIFGQFFDHGLDKITNGGNGSVFVPLEADDPLVTRGPDGIAGNGDEVEEGLQFMQLTRGTIVPGPDGFRNAPNTDTPFVDQSQTYTSHASHQFFLREYDSTSGTPKATGQFLDKTGDDHGLATWADVKTQAETQLGIELQDNDVNDIPMVVTDQYGNYIPGPARGMPQYVLLDGVTFAEGDTAAPVQSADVKKIGVAFLNDIARSAAPTLSGGVLNPDSNSTAGGSLDTPSPGGSYDDELLDLHAICGDGRCNENIALQAIHQVFHNEHNRLVEDIETTLGTDTDLLAAYQDVNLASGTDRTFTYEERLFQAARFVTEMEYQHLVFEEFARKVQPAINPFEAFAFNQTDVDPAITAEFAHAVYRFGHSMLTEDIARTNPDGSPNDIPLLDGFLNPAEFYRGADGDPVDAKAGATAIIMGMSDQTGNEIDEFVTNVLRNNLLGLPLDLPAINMTRARSEGIPPLNEVRRQIFAASNDGQLTPYTNWVDFGQALKHPSSLVNFVAAYGTHDIITSETTLAGKRTAAERIVNGLVLPGPDGILADNPATLGVDESEDNVNPPADSGEFMFGTDSWADAGGKTSTGVDDIDLWVGGLAETTNPFGGLLGTTFNYVFENQLTNLQNGDRFYYLARTPGMNLRAQLEGNSFSELMMRNTDASTLKADPFATADCKFELGNLTGAGVSGNFITGPGSVNDDPASECNENRLLLRQPNGTIEYRARNSVDPSGINGQAVYNGRPGTFADRVVGGNDNDTFWGGAGNDVIDGGSGDDVVLGGEGDDIITDLAGADVPKGGPGNDAIDGGIGDDIIMGGDGKDFTNGGANLNEHFLGAGDDFAIAGQGTDAVFGDSGDDWAEGGDQPDLLIGDSSTLFFDDHNLPGHDILIGQGGDDDYDMEGGDDIGVGGPGVEKNAGASGWDWVIGQEDPQPQNQDLNLVIINAPPANETRDRFNEVEALSGWNLNDTLKGDDVIPSQLGGIGFIGCDALDQNGLDRIAGLDPIVPPLTVPIGTVTANSVTQHCLLEGNVWGEGNILLGGGGADVLEGRGADDIIDGDRYLSVRLSVRTNADGTGPELGSATLMEKIPTGTGWTGPLAGKTLQQAVFAGLVNPGQIVAVREIVTAPAGTDLDTARFAGNRAEFTITDLRSDAADPRIIVDHNAPDATRVRVPNDCPTAAPGCGVDIVRNVERLEFLDQTVAVGTPVASLSATSLDFGTRSTVAAPFTRPVNITNTGNGNLTVTGATVGGPNAGLFTVTNGCTTVVPGATCTVSVAFRTTTTGAKPATLSITHNAAGSPSTVALTGVGVVNTAATGLPAVDDATPTEGSAVTVTNALIADADGLVGTTFSPQWQFSNAAGTVFTNIAGATSPTFTPAQAQVGRRLRVVVTFVDNHGTTETRTSSATGVVGDLFPGPGETNAGANTRNGTTGDDIFAGGPGADNLTLGAGDDQVSGDAGNDTINTGGGNDTISFTGVGDGFDTVTGGADNDRIEARTPGTDIGLLSVNGVETITGNGFANVRIVGTGAAQTFNFNNVTLTDITSINGGGGADNITGSQAADMIIGGAAVDTVNGQDGDDVIEGGAGNDVLNGQVGNDQFRYTAAFNADTVNGFDTNPGGGGQDKIDLRGVGVNPGNFATRVSITVVNATTTLVTVNGTGGTIRLNNVAAASVDATDFIVS